jgi:hypothetical protein
LRIEAIRARLFDVGRELQCTFERALPLPGADEFDLTVRERENRKRGENTTRRPDVINFLVAHGVLADGAKLWLLPAFLPADLRDQWQVDDARFQFELVADPKNPKFRWRPTEGEEQTFPPSTALYWVVQRLDPEREFRRYHAVHEKFSTQPNGKAVGELAAEHGWASDSDE